MVRFYFFKIYNILCYYVPSELSAVANQQKVTRNRLTPATVKTRRMTIMTIFQKVPKTNVCVF